MRYQHVKTGVVARAVAWRHGRPSKKVKVVLVTGQDGTVGTVLLLAAMLEATGARVGVITGQFVQIAGERVRGSDQAAVTASADHLQGLLAQMRRAGCAYALVEVPAELPAHQFVGVSPYAVVIRRCGDNYIEQSALLVATAQVNHLLALRPQYVVYNRDDPVADNLAWLQGRHGVMSFGTQRGAECRISSASLHIGGSQVSLTVDHQTALAMATYQIGKQAVYNAAAAAATAYILQIPVSAIEQGCMNARGVQGQLQAIQVARPYRVMADSAVTLAGMAETLEAARQFSKNRLLVVYGAPLGVPSGYLSRIGELIASKSDRFIVTDAEFTANQSPKQLRERIMEGVAHSGGDAKAEEIPDRQAALEKAVTIARRGDVVLVLSTTLRPYRQLGSEHRPWSDIAALTQLFET